MMPSLLNFTLLLICALGCARHADSFQFIKKSPLLVSKTSTPASSYTKIAKLTHLYSSLPPTQPQEQTYDAISPSHPLSQLIQHTSAACEPRRLDTTADAHEAFRYEWGTWCSEEKLDSVMEILGSIRLREGWEDVINAGSNNVESVDETTGVRDGGRRIRVAGGKYWDVILHMLPKNS
jgi:hypothetical protein